MENTKIKLSFGEKIFSVINYTLMILIIVATLYPILYVLFASLSNPAKLMEYKGLLLYPLGFSLNSYVKVFQYPLILTGYANTLIIVVLGVSLNMILTAFGGYVLSKKSFYFSNIIMKLIIFTMFFSGGIIPFYFTVRNLGMGDSLAALIFPSAINTFNLVIMRTGFASIPDALEEAARIDGADHFKILFAIALPLLGPVLAVIALYYTVGHWNSWFNAMIFLRNHALYPLQLVLREILIMGNTSEMTTNTGNVGDVATLSDTIKYSVIIVSTVPVLILYPFLQRYFVKGVMIGAVKG